MINVKITPASNGRVLYETVSGDKQKRIYGIAHNEDDAKRRVKEYAGDDVNFICERAGLVDA
jgi:hypothetical protein